MTETILHIPAPAERDTASSDISRQAMTESRQRWRAFVDLAADMAFETDAAGRFVFISPAHPLGWPADTLIGQPSERLAEDDGTGFNPFRPAAALRRRRTWLRRHDGSLALMLISAEPLPDFAGRITGARGVCIDMTECDAKSSLASGTRRRNEVVDHILSCVSRESTPAEMMDAALWALTSALGAEGAAVIVATSHTTVRCLHERGAGAAVTIHTAARLLQHNPDEPAGATAPDGRLVIAAGCRTRFSAEAGLMIWRAAAERPWDREDTMIAGSAAGVVRMILDYEAVQQDMAEQARTDTLTGLLNRRAFLDELLRQCTRLDEESAPGTLLLIDMDPLRAVNDHLGSAAGDAMLVRLGGLLRRMVRPSDLTARLGGDEFAVWMSGADHMTAAERADHLCRTAPDELAAVLSEPFPGLGVSVGLATRAGDSEESLDELMQRAGIALYAAKQAGRGNWQMSQEGKE